MIKLFNQSIGRLRLTTTKSLILASLLVGALVTLLSAPVLAAGPSPQDRGGRPASIVSVTGSISRNNTYDEFRG